MSFDKTTIHLIDDYYWMPEDKANNVVEILKGLGFDIKRLKTNEDVILYSENLETEVLYDMKSKNITLYSPNVKVIDNEYMKNIIESFRFMRYKLNEAYEILNDNNLRLVTDGKTQFIADKKIQGYIIEHRYHKNDDDYSSFLFIKLKKDCFADIKEREFQKVEED